MSLWTDMLESRGFIVPSRFETTVKTMCLVASLAAVCWAGAWTALWLLPILTILTMLSEGLKRLYWKGFDPFIQRGAARGDFARLLFWNGLTVVLDWTLCCVAPVLGAVLLEKFTGGKPLMPLFKWLYFWMCLFPPLMYPRVKGVWHARLYTDTLRWMPAIPLVLSLFLPVSPMWVLALYAVAAIPMVGITSYFKLPGWMDEFDKYYDAAKSGVVDVPVSNGRRWRPREGILFEPRISGVYAQFDAASQEMVRKTFTIRRINWFGCIASLTMFVVGAVLSCVYASSLALLIAIPGILFGLAIGLAVSDMDRKRLREDHEERALMLLIAYSLAGVLVLWLGGRDLMRLVSVALLMTSSFMFFTGFIVRGSSEGVNDTLDFVSFAFGIAAVIVCRLCLNCVWWETLLPLVLSAGIPGFIRMRWPRTDLPFVPKTEPILLDYKKEQKARRERKRERQIAALRRSQRR